MNPTPSIARHQQQRLSSISRQCSSYQLFNWLTDDLLLNEVEKCLPEHRERLYPPTETLSMFLAQAMSEDRSCQNVVIKLLCNG